MASTALAPRRTHVGPERRPSQAWAADKDNWLEPLWDTGYLETRLANPVNINYFLHLAQPTPGSWAEEPSHQLHHAAVLLAAAADFHAQVAAEALPAETDPSGAPVCMSQYARMFGHARLARAGCDELRNYTTAPSGLPTRHFATQFMGTNPRHVAVMHKGHVGVLDILGEGGAPLPAPAILASLVDLADAFARQPEPEACIGAATFLERDTAARVRLDLEGTHGPTADSLHQLDSALFVVCLDDEDVENLDGSPLAEGAPADESTTTQRVMLGHPEHGNRWFDKHNLIVRPHGTAAWNLEHAQGDATPFMSLFAAQVSHRAACMAPPQPAPGASTARLLLFSPSETALGLLRQGQAEWRAMEARVRSHAFRSPGLGSAAVKAAGCSPDAFVQSAFQVAAMRLHGKALPAYESVATRGFLHGRTEVGRSTSVQSKALAEEMCRGQWRGGGAPLQAAGAALDAALSAQTQYLREAKAGQGVDRHLFGLQSMAWQAGEALPPFLGDGVLAASSKWRLSTSNAGSLATSRFGYGPVVPGGYGLGYMVHPDEVIVSVTAFEDGQGEDKVSADDFAVALGEALHDLHAVAVARQEPSR